MKKIFIAPTAVENNKNLSKGLARNLYFINKSLAYEIFFSTAPSEMVSAILKSEGIAFQVMANDTEQSAEDVFINIDNAPGYKMTFTPNDSWDNIYHDLRKKARKGEVVRTTKETDITISLSLEGNGKTNISTGLSFFDHMLDQIGKHSGSDLDIKVNGDLNVDEHHTIEDTAIALGEAFSQAIGDKKGLARYGFFLPMDESICWVAIDFGGRPWLNWVADFKREYVGDMPTEMFMHFFKSFSDAAKCNLYIKAEGHNEHHIIEGVFKAFAKAIKMAIKQEPYSLDIPSTKGLL